MTTHNSSQVPSYLLEGNGLLTIIVWDEYDLANIQKIKDQSVRVRLFMADDSQSFAIFSVMFMIFWVHKQA